MINAMLLASAADHPYKSWSYIYRTYFGQLWLTRDPTRYADGPQPCPTLPGGTC